MAGWRGKDAFTQQVVRPLQHGIDFGWAEIRPQVQAQRRTDLQQRGQCRDAGQQAFGNRVSGSVPDHRAEFVLLVEAKPVIDDPQLACACFDQHMTTFAVRVVHEQIEQCDRRQARLVFLTEAEVVVFRVVFDVLLQRPGSVWWNVLTQHSAWHKAETQRLAYEIGCDFAARQGVFRKIPEGLLAPRRFVHGPQFTTSMAHV